MPESFYMFDDICIVALTSLANARPLWWGNSNKAILNSITTEEDYSKVIANVKAHRLKLLHWRTHLPAEHSLSLFILKDDSAPYYFEVKATNNNPNHDFNYGSSFRSWLLSAYASLDQIILISEEMIKTCESNPFKKERDKPLFPDVVTEDYIHKDPLVTFLATYIQHFDNQTAEEVARVFKERKGLLKMSNPELGIAAFVLEGIRVGLALMPRQLDDIRIHILNKSTIHTWRQ